jgi:hypothetical protein
MLYENSGGTCSAIGSVAGATVVAVGAAVDPSLLVATHVEREPRGARLSADLLVSDDGARQVTNLYDLTRAAACQPATDTAQEGSFVVALQDYACVPSDLAFDTGNLFADSACAARAASYGRHSLATCGRQPTLVVRQTSAMPSATYFELGPQLTTPAYQMTSSCMLYAPPASVLETLYGVGAAAPFSTFAPLLVHNEGAGRIALVTLRTETGELAGDLGFFDVTQNRTCDTLLATDGKDRCLSFDISGFTIYADSACTMGILDVPPGFQIVPGSTLASGTQQGSVVAIFQVQAKIATPTMAWRSGNTCAVTTVTSGDDFYSTTPVAPTDFVEVVRQVE